MFINKRKDISPCQIAVKEVKACASFYTIHEIKQTDRQRTRKCKIYYTSFNSAAKDVRLETQFPIGSTWTKIVVYKDVEKIPTGPK